MAKSRITSSSNALETPQTQAVTADSAGESNQALIDSMESPIKGVLGQLFNRIRGLPEDSTESGTEGFDEDQLKEYIRHKLDFAEREMFRGAKIGGVASKMMEELDSNADGIVDWTEFQATVSRLRSSMGLEEGDVELQQIEEAAGAQFDETSRGGSEIGFDGLENAVAGALSPETDHLDLVAQFAARLAIDLADQDQRELPVADRSLSRDEWVSAAKDLAQTGD
jgi:hypothetical protein